MKAGQKGLSALLMAVMELSWLYAWAAFVSAAVLGRAFPLPEAVVTFSLAALTALPVLRRLIGGRGWSRAIWIMLLKGIVFSACALAMLHAFTDRPEPFYRLNWLMELPRRTLGLPDWLKLILIGGMAVAFWRGGALLARRPLNHTCACRRFDLGVTAFLVLFAVKLVIVYKGGVPFRDPYSQLLVFPFFICGLLAMGLIHRRSTPVDYLSGFRGLGLILSASVVVTCLGAAAALLLLPYLTGTAEGTYTLLKTTAGPLQPVLIALLRFMFGRRHLHGEPVRRNPESDDIPFADPSAGSGWTGSIHDLAQWSLVALVVLLAMAVAGVLLWWLVHWVSIKFRQVETAPDPSISLRDLLKRVLSGILRLWQGILGLRNKSTSSKKLFGAVMRWGRRSGFPRIPAETPLEYSLRLARAFPTLNREIALIVEAYHIEIFRDIRLDSTRLRPAKAAWKSLRSPRHWPARLRAKFNGTPSWPR